MPCPACRLSSSRPGGLPHPSDRRFLLRLQVRTVSSLGSTPALQNGFAHKKTGKKLEELRIDNSFIKMLRHRVIVGRCRNLDKIRIAVGKLGIQRSSQIQLFFSRIPSTMKMSSDPGNCPPVMYGGFPRKTKNTPSRLPLKRNREGVLKCSTRRLRPEDCSGKSVRESLFFKGLRQFYVRPIGGKPERIGDSCTDWAAYAGLLQKGKTAYSVVVSYPFHLFITRNSP